MVLLAFYAVPVAPHAVHVLSTIISWLSLFALPYEVEALRLHACIDTHTTVLAVSNCVEHDGTSYAELKRVEAEC